MADETTDATQPHDDFDIPLIQDNGPGPGTGTPGEPSAAPADQGSESSLPPDLLAALQDNNLRSIPGESTEDAYRRLSIHLTGRTAAIHKRANRAEETHSRELAAIRQGLEPILREHYDRQRRAQLEEAAAQIPPRDSPEYQVWLQEENLRRMDEREQREAEAAQRAQASAEQAYTAQQLAAVDNSGYAKVAEGLGLSAGAEADPEFTAAFEILSQSAMTAARQYFTDAPEEKLQEFVALSQQLDIRRAEMNGVDIRDVLKARLGQIVDGLVRMGFVTRAAGSAGGSGNGATAAQPRTVAPTTAQRVQATAASAARRGPTAGVPATTRPNAALPDPSGFDSEEDYVEAALSGLLGGEEQRTAGHRKSR